MTEQAKEEEEKRKSGKSNDNEAEISFIDFRPLILEYKYQAMIGKENLADNMNICMNHFEIARFINNIYTEDKYPLGEIDDQKIMRTLITY